MPKTPSLKLFNLIKSLSGSEKRYFKLFIRENKNEKTSKYALLFDSIDEQEANDEEALKAIIYKDEPIQSRKYSELKAYLYELILKSLQGYDEKSSVDYKLKGMLHSVRVLYKRSHYSECKELLVKAKKVAYKYESFIHILEVLKWEKQIAYAQSDIVFLDKELDRINNEENECLEQRGNLSAYQNLFYRVMIGIRKDALLRSEEKVANLNLIMENKLLTDLRNAKSHKARVFYFRIYSLFYYSIINYEKFHIMSKRLMRLMESQAHFLREDIADYISALTNYTASCGLLEYYEEVAECLPKFLVIKPKTLDDELRVYNEYYTNKFSLCIFTGDFKEGELALKQHLKEQEKFDSEVFESGRFYFQYFYIHFGIGDYPKALEYLNEWLNLPRRVERQDLQSLARILNLIIHYEMGNTMLLEYLFRSTYRFLRKRNRMFEFEKKVLGFIKESNKIHSLRELMHAFANLKDEFEKLTHIPSEKVMFQYFDFISWLESKIENESFAEVVRRKSNYTK